MAYLRQGKLEPALATETVSRVLKLTGERGERRFETRALPVMPGDCDAAERLEDAKTWCRARSAAGSRSGHAPLPLYDIEAPGLPTRQGILPALGGLTHIHGDSPGPIV